MKRKFKPALRLSIVFILAVIVSGSILTYFSINNISNLKELTEKKILEEQRQLSSRFSTAVQNKLEEVTNGFTNEIKSIALLRDSLYNISEHYDFISQPFIFDSSNHFIYPNFIGIAQNTTRLKLLNSYKSSYANGEKAEFAKKDLISAYYYYSMCLSYSTGSSDSAKVLNAMGRVSVKSNDYKNAAIHYKLITSNYFRLTDNNGIPYTYYALPQLLEIANFNHTDKVLPVIEFCYKKMEAGLIPLNYHTMDLLNSVKQFLETNTFNDRTIILHIKQLEEKIVHQLQFINVYRDELSEILKKRNLNNRYLLDNGFMIVSLFSGNNNNVLLINKSVKNPAGFVIDRKILLDDILKTNPGNGFEFNYKIEFPTSYNSNSAGQSLIYLSQLNPCLPGQLIRIKLADENVLKDFIERRSWIYGIATALLLLAMFLGVTLILRDISREKHLARLRSDFISNVTHELKTPLTSIHMFSESLLLERIKTTTEKKEYLSIIIKESERLKRMINNILEFSKNEKAKSKYHFVKSNLASVINSVIDDMNYWLKEEKFNLVKELDENINADIDSDKMKQAINNLLNNAIKYSITTKSIFIRLYKNDNHIYIEVEDKGIGIPKDQLSRIFEKFYRIDQQESISGTGLGLTVVKEIVEAHNGKIIVASEPGKGSKFSIILNEKQG